MTDDARSTNPAPPPQRGARWVRLGMVAAVLTMLVVAHQTGLLAIFGDPARVKALLLELGAWGYVAFVVAYAILQPFGVPGTVFVMAAPLIWSWPVAFALSMTGTMAASMVGFSFARFVARDWVSTRIPKRFGKYEEALARRGFTTVAVLRFVFWMPPLLHAFFGVSKVRFATHFWGSLVGYAIPLFLVSYFGQRLFDMMNAAPREVWIGLVAALVLLVAGAYVWRRCRGSARAVSPTAP